MKLQNHSVATDPFKFQNRPMNFNAQWKVKLMWFQITCCNCPLRNYFKHIQMVHDFWWFNLQFLDIMTMGSDTHSVETILWILSFSLFLSQDMPDLWYSLEMLGRISELQLWVSHIITRANNWYTYNHSRLRGPFHCTFIQYSMN